MTTVHSMLAWLIREMLMAHSVEQRKLFAVVSVMHMDKKESVAAQLSRMSETGKIWKESKRQKHTTGGIPRWSPTLVLVARFSAYVWQSGRDAQFSLTYGRMYLLYRKPQS